MEKYSITLAIENIYGAGFQDVHHSTAEDFLFYMDHLQSPYLSVCFDTGHVIKSSTAVLRIGLLEYKKQ